MDTGSRISPANGKTPDGTFLDGFNLARGYWEAKDTRDDLETEIKKKFDLGYPPDNILFEDSRRAVLFQGRANRAEFDLTRPDELRALLRQFTAYSAPDTETFHEAVREFQTRVPELAEGLKERIETERQATRPSPPLSPVSTNSAARPSIRRSPPIPSKRCWCSTC